MHLYYHINLLIFFLVFFLAFVLTSVRKSSIKKKISPLIDAIMLYHSCPVREAQSTKFKAGPTQVNTFRKL